MRSGFRLVPVLLSLALLAACVTELVGNVLGTLDTSAAPLRLAGRGAAPDAYDLVPLDGLGARSAVDLDTAAAQPPGTATVAYFVSDVDASSRSVTVKVSLFVPGTVLADLTAPDPASGRRVSVAAGRVASDETGDVAPGFGDQKLTLVVASCGHDPADGCDPSPAIDIPLSRVAGDIGAANALSGPEFSTVLTLPAFDANPSAYPGDGYALHLRAALATVPPLAPSWDSTPAHGLDHLALSAAAGQDQGFAGRQVDVLVHPAPDPAPGAVGSDQTDPSLPVANIYVFRSLSSKLYVYGMALVPILFALMLLGVVRRPGRGHDGGADIGAVLGLIAATLTVLPLRSVLVPDEFRGLSITRVDLVLGTEVAALLTLTAFLFAAGAWPEWLRGPLLRLRRGAGRGLSPWVLLAGALGLGVAGVLLPWSDPLGQSTPASPAQRWATLGLLVAAVLASAALPFARLRAAGAGVLLLAGATATVLALLLVVAAYDTIARPAAGVAAILGAGVLGLAAGLRLLPAPAPPPPAGAHAAA